MEEERKKELEFLGNLLYKISNEDKKWEDLDDDNKKRFSNVAMNFLSITLKRIEYLKLEKTMNEVNDFIKK